ncbi:MAG: PAS domain S-box protein [Azonexus sp.]|jgi:PAS domain S-box-containing protein|nr:PAS domain S-box protein [Betaproteobacteria bacterium]MBK8916974.1 PAS domain S-box protein [Betaproteobacteria bacterium]MBP6036069.1 PAS domain S-box protein [Azonexus sp.]MBP6906592.1 PAS domain S-box protein [Azonexus sp.]
MSAAPYAAVAEQMADALIYADRAGHIVLWNRAAEALFGHPAAAARGQSLDIIIPERLRAAHWAGYHRALAAGRTRGDGSPTRSKALTAAGETIYVEMSFAVVSDDAGQPLGSVAVARRAPPPAR